MGSDQYLVEHIRDVLASDPRVHEIELQVSVAGDKAVITGTVPTEERRAAVTKVVKEHFPDLTIDNQTRVPRFDAEPQPEQLG
jgi:BON domain